MISDDEKEKLICLIRLILLLDSALLWDGKTEEELTGETNMRNVSVNISDLKEKNFKDTIKLFNSSSNYCSYDFTHENIDNIFIRKIRPLRLGVKNDEHLKVALEVMKEDILGQKEVNFSEKYTTSRVMLFEMMKFCLENDGIYESRKQLLKSFSQYYDIEDQYFNDLLKQTQIVHKEIQKTIYLILE